MSGHFYDQVAREFGASPIQLESATEHQEDAPETVFERKIVALGEQEKSALDAGCGMGEFTLQISTHFGQITGIDSSIESLKLARQEQQTRGNTRVQFLEQDAHQTDFADATFDVVYSRRGPTPYPEFFRILKPGGHFIHIGIGEKDAWELKVVFGRGQGYHEWKQSALEQCAAHVQEAGFQVVYGQDFEYDSYYASYANLNLFLQTVPIFEDFNAEKDRARLETYVSTSQSEKGIPLPRHRFVIVAQKA